MTDLLLGALRLEMRPTSTYLLLLLYISAAMTSSFNAGKQAFLWMDYVVHDLSLGGKEM